MPDRDLDDVYSRLSRSAREVMSNAEGIRVAQGVDKVHMEVLILALYDRVGGPVHRAFEQLEVSRAGLLKRLRDRKGTPIPERYSPVGIQALPPLSSHARKAVLAARKKAGVDASLPISITHLFHGVMSVRDCHVVKALSRFNLQALADTPDGDPDPVTPETPATQKRVSSAGPARSDANVLLADDVERHVAEALTHARGLSDGSTITAERALLGIAWTSGSSSDAFEKLRQLLLGFGGSLPPPTEPASSLQTSFALSAGLSAALALARAVGGRKTVWGRALVTAILFGPESLEGPSDFSRYPEWREIIQTQWMDFLEKTDSPFGDDWARAVEEIGNLAARSAYLLTWNPEEFAFSDLGKYVSELERDGETKFGWSLGVRRQVTVGDRVYLLRQGPDRAGLIGSGTITDRPRETRHWNATEAAKGRTYVAVPVRWNALATDPILPRETLDSRLGKPELWRTQGGGIRLDPDLVSQLDVLWKAAGYAVLGTENGRDVVAFLDPDRPSAEAVDHLDVEREAFAFARLAASKETRLPLSIGVFGEWGSGKTFFMEKMRTHVDRLQKRAHRATREAQPTAYHTDIVQIQFNAWHYMETNLWASLVDHIFREMDKWLRSTTTAPAEQIEALYKRLSTSRMLRLEALEQLVIARQRRKEAEQQVQNARHDLAKAEADAGSTTLVEFWQAVRETLQAQNPLPDSQRKQITNAAKALGFGDVSHSAKGLMNALKEAQDETRRGNLLVRSLMARVTNPWWMLALIALLVLVPVGAPMLVKWFFASFPIDDIVARVGGVTTAISATLAAATAWVSQAVAVGKRSLVQLGEFQNRLDEALKQREEKTPQRILEAEQILDQKRTAVVFAETALEAATKQLVEARSDFGQTAATRLNRFIRDKIANGDYAKHLGVIASVRKDFEQLSAMMASLQVERAALEQLKSESKAYREKVKSLEPDKLVQDGLITPQERQDLESEEQTADQHFQRIILYIDDLDRCPPKNVVEVLQACHLLLSFPLFVVVVAVDARWVSGALLDQYKGLIADFDEIPVPSSKTRATATNTGIRYGRGSASPRDYLEKIFQIPYWVRHMDRDARQNYTTYLVGAVRSDATADGNGAKTAASVVASGNAMPSVVHSEPLPTGDAPPPTQPADTGSQTQTQQSGSPPPERRDTPDARLDASVGTEGSESVEPTLDANPESLRLTSYERDFLARLAEWAGDSPRTIKRFVNVYRLLRTGLRDQQLRRLVGPTGASDRYRACIGQLAIVTGAPSLADDYFEVLGPAGLDNKLTARQLMAALEKKPGVKSSSEWKRVAGALRALAETGDSGSLIDAMRDTADVVKRYSFSARSYL